MNFNYSIQNAGAVAWNGTAAVPVDIRPYIGFSFSFQVLADIAADTKFNIQAAPPSDADACLPGAFADIEEVLTCVAGGWVQPGPKSEITIPAGTKKGSLCSASLPCRPGAFIQAVGAGAGAAAIMVVVTLHGPK